MPRKHANREDQLRLGDQTPRYEFFLNPYVDARFTACPREHGPMRQRKLPLVIHIDDWGLLVLNKTCRFCPTCELVVLHQDELEDLLAQAFDKLAPQVIGNKYFVVGTLDRSDWRKSLKQPLTTGETIAALHDFLRHVKFEQPGWGWVGPDPRSIPPFANRPNAANPMSQADLEQRVTQLEQQVVQILQHLSEALPPRDAWKKTVGMFRGDPVFGQMLEETARREAGREEAHRDLRSR